MINQVRSLFSMASATPVIIMLKNNPIYLLGVAILILGVCLIARFNRSSRVFLPRVSNVPLKMVYLVDIHNCKTQNFDLTAAFFRKNTLNLKLFCGTKDDPEIEAIWEMRTKRLFIVGGKCDQPVIEGKLATATKHHIKIDLTNLLPLEEIPMFTITTPNKSVPAKEKSLGSPLPISKRFNVQ